MSTSYRNVTMVLGIVLLTAALLDCGPLALLDLAGGERTGAFEVKEAATRRPPSLR